MPLTLWRAAARSFCCSGLVAVDADGRVLTRYTGRLSPDQIDQLVAAVRQPAQD
jgi:hypothetical protein